MINIGQSSTHCGFHYSRKKKVRLTIPYVMYPLLLSSCPFYNVVTLQCDRYSFDDADKGAQKK